VTEEPVRRRAGEDLTSVWSVLRDQVESLPSEYLVDCRVRSERAEMFSRLFAVNLVAPPEPRAGAWTHARLAFRAQRAVRALLVMGAAVEVLDPPEARAELVAAAREVLRLYASGE
jgi:hypothetical protein